MADEDVSGGELEERGEGIDPVVELADIPLLPDGIPGHSPIRGEGIVPGARGSTDVRPERLIPQLGNRPLRRAAVQLS